MQSAFTDATLTRDPQPADNFVLWLPVFLCCGIGTYFIMPFETPVRLAWQALGGTVLATLATWRMREGLLWRWVVAFLIALTLGFVLAQHQARNIPTKLLYRSMWRATITGTIDSFERAGAGWRVLLRDAKINNGKGSYRLRLTVRLGQFTPVMNATITAQGSLLAPSPPIVPGGFDFRRHAFFNGISGYGYATKILDYQPPDADMAENQLEEYRDWLTEKVYRVLHQPEAGIVAALLNGQRAGIARQTTQVLQKSGLQHVISISGLHVGLMAITVFFMVRLLLACSMTLALRWPIKKIAAAAALVGIVFYLLVVGNSPPTLRAVLMSGAALVAMMLDREPIQMRVVALSALAILLIQPQSMIDIGFQMSFAAVIGLVAFYQQTRNFWSHARWNESFIMKSARIFLATIATSVVATVVTAPLVLYYFQQIPLLSMLANLLATPPVTFLVMPGTFLAYLLTPFPGLGDLAIRMMGLGVMLMLKAGHFVAGLPVAVWQTPPLPLVSVPVMLLGFYIIISVKHISRFAGIALVFAGLLIAPMQTRPDLYLAQARLVLYPDPHGDVLYADGRVQAFDRSILLQWTGKSKVQPFDCADDICDLEIKGKTIRLIRTVPALEQACRRPKVDLIVTRFYLDKPCVRTLVLDRHDLDRSGGQAVWLDDAIKVQTARHIRMRRPWQ